MRKKLAITVDEAIYEGLHRIVGRGKISQFIEDPVWPYVADAALDDGYRAMAADQVREAEALEWSEALAVDVADEAQ